ncbi:hypothetical protein PGQ11_012799 [Apiospora arundinis]|uniref:Uncharacterized protein n=1 Tax=Apiospora arundinis TaxID=335852 RepID=A0ABR2I3Y7_9PEZI
MSFKLIVLDQLRQWHVDILTSVFGKKSNGPKHRRHQRTSNYPNPTASLGARLWQYINGINVEPKRHPTLNAFPAPVDVAALRFVESAASR